jgi:NAD(P)-dependent dehydrogenase (short-subunit alcohol dehydrogenase family)
MTLSSKSIAVVTGAGSGIGRALTLRLAADGIRGLAISDVNESGLNETRAQISDSATKIDARILDVSNRSQMENYARETVSVFGGVTHLFNNAGVGLIGDFEQISLDDFAWLMNTNFWGVVHGTRFFLPVLKQQDQAHIINISSVFGLVAPPEQTAYCASKFAVRGFTESLRHELSETNVRVSSVHPGGIKTNIARNSRLGAKTPVENKQQGVKFFDKVAKTSAETAAKTILRGVKKENPRILIGADAQAINYIHRLFPKSYLKIFEMIAGHKLDLRKKT